MSSSHRTGAVPPAVNLLLQYRANLLRSIAERALGPHPPTEKGRLAPLIASRLEDPEYVAQALAALDRPARQVVERIQRIGRPIDWRTLATHLVVDGVVEAPRYEARYRFRPETPQEGKIGARGSLVYQDVLARIEVTGLVLGLGPLSRTASVVDFGLAHSYAIPSEIAAHLPEPPPLTPRREVEPTEIIAGDPSAFSHELYLIWSYIWSQRPTPLRAGTLSKADLRGLAARLPFEVDVKAARSETDLPRILIDRSLLHHLGLVIHSKNLEVDLDAARAFWRKPLAERLNDCWDARLNTQWWNELLVLPATQGGQSVTQAGEDPEDLVARARQRVAEVIGQFGSGDQWLPIGEVIDAVRMCEPNILSSARSRHSSRTLNPMLPDGLSHRGADSGHDWPVPRYHDGLPEWDLLQVPFIVLMLDAAHHFGLLDMGLDEAGRLTAVRMTPMGRHVLSGYAAPAHERDREYRVVVQPNFRIVSLDPIDESTWLQLEHFADTVAADRAVELELSRESLYRAQRLGMDAADVRELLTELTDGPLPQNVDRTLAEWQRKHEQIEIHSRVPLLQAATPELMTEISEAADGALCLLSPTLAQVLDGDAVNAALEGANLSPLATGIHDVRPEAMLDDAGAVTFRQQTPHIHVLGRLQRLAEWDAEQSTWCVKRSSAQHAQRVYGMDADAQLEAWNEILAGTTPDWLEKKLRAWTGYYGRATLQHTVLLRLPSEEALGQLLESATLAKAIERLEPGGAYAVVDAERLDELRQVLDDLGIELQDV